MNVPLLTWICVVTAVVLVILVKLTHHNFRHIKIFSIGRECEQIYIPGDKILHDDYDIDDDEL